MAQEICGMGNSRVPVVGRQIIGIQQRFTDILDIRTRRSVNRIPRSMLTHVSSWLKYIRIARVSHVLTHIA
eukprot:3548412-Amphidinium_carterae.1